ncbi:hypothetical protein JIN77_06485 [Verrucomicrobiaceae bacterium R5-34]|uniref:Uncharacterized protein n=1 Tax=Oceaniferula flava TaxID=2800421 RepID=A0AAE2VC00_9BACT|nr:hypothetical protein [Oceaniferula flavus]MBK1830364.1 hypothetical protein [Verrucomicrobiaceae bacterium R5-34]MBK1854456.1 hypothetical protein [Oceaniferula flavus]MBM1135762.1 hypothetical protein [Oceaniferula flavus]
MKNTLPILSTMALGVIAGVTGTHFQQVSSMVANGSLPSPALENIPDSPHSGEGIPREILASLTSSPRVSDKQMQSEPAAASSLTVDERSSLEQTLLTINGNLQRVMKENSHLRKQLSDTNRDMDELTFRLDSQSASFRPLSTQQDRPRGLITSPSTGLPAADQQELLPAKN